MISGQYKILTSVEDQAWDVFVANHPQGNIFQTRYIYEVFRNTRNYHPLKLFAVDQNSGQIGGVLVAVIVNEMGGLLKGFSSHSIIQGGPLVLPGQESVLFPLLIQEHDKISSRKALYSETRNMHDVKESLAGFKDYVYEDHLNFLINLAQSEESLWQHLHRAKKNHINKAQKLNVEIVELKDKEELPIFYRLIKETYKNAKIPLADYSLFASAFDILRPPGMVKFFLARNQNNYIAAQNFLVYKKTIFAWYLGAERDFLNFHPNEYLTWYALKWGIRQGYQVFDFGGAGSPEAKYGPRDYKREFGGQEVNLGRHKCIYKPFQMKITQAGFGVYRRIISIRNRFK